MHLRSDSRRYSINHVKLAAMTERTHRIIGRLIAVLRLLAVLALAGSPAVPAAFAASGDLIGQSAPDFALPAAAGDNVRLSESLGQPVILSFWGTHCSECAAQLGRLDRLYQTYRSSGLVVFAVSVDDDMPRAERYARAHPMHYPLLLDQSKGVSRAYQIDRLPTTVLIDRSGVVRYLHDRYRANDPTYIAQIRALLDDQEAPRPAPTGAQ